jgi:hypothetical protein
MSHPNVSVRGEDWLAGPLGLLLTQSLIQPDVIHKTGEKKELGVAPSLWSLIVFLQTIKPCHVGSFPRLRDLWGPEAPLCHPQISTLTCLRVGVMLDHPVLI